jgi:hypothetical protein
VPPFRHQRRLAAARDHRRRSDRLDPNILLHDALAEAEPKKLRYRLLHTAARIVHGQRRTMIKIDTGWPWAAQLAAAFNRLTEIRPPLLV